MKVETSVALSLVQYLSFQVIKHRRDLAIINRRAKRLNEEAEGVLAYQVILRDRANFSECATHPPAKINQLNRALRVALAV